MSFLVITQKNGLQAGYKITLTNGSRALTNRCLAAGFKEAGSMDTI
jgi:hypothetical protein